MTQYKEQWELAVNAFNGSGGFYDDSYIDKYPRESDDKYKERQNVAFYDGMFSQKVGRYIGYLYKQKPIRTTSNDFMSIIIKDADKQGNNINVVMSSFATNAKTRGAMLMLVDMPKEIPSTLAEQISQRALPYLVPVEPERVTDYKLDKFGRFEWVMYSDTIDKSTPEESKTIDVTRYYDAEEWKVIDSDDNILERGTHKAGVCPIIPFSESDVFPSVGEFTKVGALAKRHYNLNSELDEILRAQTFSLLTIQAKNDKDVTLSLGTDNALRYGENMDRPEFISPPSAPADTYQKRIVSLEERINDVTYDISTGSSVESGIALEIKFQGLNGSLSNFAMRMNNMEMKIFDIMFNYLDQNNDIEIQYPDEFNIVDVNSEVETLDSINSAGFVIPAYNREKLKRIVSNDLGSMSEDVKMEIEKQIDDISKEAPPQE